MKLLTVVIPHYNSYESLDNLLLTLSDIERINIIVVDDSSDDAVRLGELKEKYKYVSFFSNDSNNSAGVCRNIGLYNVKTNWVTFVDADDRVCHSKVNKIIDKLDKYKDYDILFSDPSSIKDNGEESNRTNNYSYLYEKAKLGIDDILYWFHVPWSKIYRTEFIQRNKIIFSNTIVSNDVLFSLKAGILCDKYGLLDEGFYTVVESSTSLTSIKTRTKDKTFTRIEILDEYNSILDENNKGKYKIPRMIYVLKLPRRDAFRYLTHKGIIDVFSDFSAYYLYDKIRRLIVKAS